MIKTKLKVGDIILIPLEGGGFGVGKILFLSKRFRNVILLGIYDQFARDISMPTLLGEMPLKLYTGQQAIKEGYWFLVGKEPLQDSQLGLSKRIVAGDVWIGDDKIGPASKDDLEKLPKMLCFGSELVKRKVRQLIQKDLTH